MAKSNCKYAQHFMYKIYLSIPIYETVLIGGGLYQFSTI